MFRKLAWKLARPLGVRMVLGWLDDAANGRNGPALHRAYWALAGWKTWTSLFLGIAAAALTALGYEHPARVLAIVAAVGVSAGLLDRAWRTPHVPAVLRDHQVYRLLAANSAGITAGLLAALAWAKSSGCDLHGSVITCATLHAALLALACACGYLGLLDASWSARSPISPAELAIQRGLAWPPAPTPPRPPRPPAAVAALAALLTWSCGSTAQLKLGHDRASHPDARVVSSYVCSGDEDAARLYLGAPAFAWLGPAIERYLTDARDVKLAGQCPCPGSGCTAR